MKKGNRVMREILYRVYDRGENFISQRSLAKTCGLSLGTVNPIISRLYKLGTIDKKPLGFRVTDPKKVLLSWASARNLSKDLIYSTYSPALAQDIEKQMPQSMIPTAYSGYKMKFGEVPVVYDEVYVYGDPVEVEQRFPRRADERQNIFVLALDPHLIRVSENGLPPTAQIYADLWQLSKPADRFIKEFEKKLELMGVNVIADLAKRFEKEFKK